MLTGVKVSHSTLQRFVQREDWCELKITEPIEELSADGGMVRLRTGAGQPGEWREYKALNVHKQGGVAFFKDNQGLLEWVNAQPRQAQFTCLGDGHDGVWNIFSGIGTPEQRIEIQGLVSPHGKCPQGAGDTSPIEADPSIAVARGDREDDRLFAPRAISGSHRVDQLLVASPKAHH